MKKIIAVIVIWGIIIVGYALKDAHQCQAQFQKWSGVSANNVRSFADSSQAASRRVLVDSAFAHQAEIGDSIATYTSGTNDFTALKVDNTGISDGGYRAFKTANGIITETVTAGAFVYYSKTTEGYHLTTNTTNATVGVALATEAGNAGETITLMFEGWYRNNGLFEFSLTAATNASIWMSDTTNGGFTDDLGTLVSEDDVIYKLGHVVTKDIIYVKPSDSHTVYDVP